MKTHKNKNTIRKRKTQSRKKIMKGGTVEDEDKKGEFFFSNYVNNDNIKFNKVFMDKILLDTFNFYKKFFEEIIKITTQSSQIYSTFSYFNSVELKKLITDINNDTHLLNIEMIRKNNNAYDDIYLSTIFYSKIIELIGVIISVIYNIIQENMIRINDNQKDRYATVVNYYNNVLYKIIRHNTIIEDKHIRLLIFVIKKLAALCFIELENYNETELSLKITEKEKKLSENKKEINSFVLPDTYTSNNNLRKLENYKRLINKNNSFNNNTRTNVENLLIKLRKQQQQQEDYMALPNIYNSTASNNDIKKIRRHIKKYNDVLTPAYRSSLTTLIESLKNIKAMRNINNGYIPPLKPRTIKPPVEKVNDPDSKKNNTYLDIFPRIKTQRTPNGTIEIE
jgi:hypothetical protein